MSGLPRLAGYLAKSWPPNFEDFDAVLRGAGETIAIATLGTTLGAVLAVPLCLLGARNITPALTLYVPARAILNVLRSIDTFVFALLFVAAVGLGPFSGILGVAFHVARIDRETLVGGDRGGRPASHRSSHRDGRLAAARLALRTASHDRPRARLGAALHVGVQHPLFDRARSRRCQSEIGRTAGECRGSSRFRACGAHHRRHPADGRVRRRLERVFVRRRLVAA